MLLGQCQVMRGGGKDGLYLLDLVLKQQLHKGSREGRVSQQRYSRCSSQEACTLERRVIIKSIVWMRIQTRS